ncbi:MAG: autophagy protein 5 [Vezdaea aestivalis]|nr:MAG: autophagy protein 5 [Vezdaea aestivalis]
MATSDASLSTLAQIQQTIWHGSIPLEIRLSPAQSRVFDDTDPYFLNVPRLHYLPLLLPRLHAFFSCFLIEPAPAHEGWFEFEGLPLKWHLPLGFLYDMFSGRQPISTLLDSQSPTANEAAEPWKLTVQFGNWPVGLLVQCDKQWEVLRDTFVNAVKEADVVRFGHARGVMGLSREDDWRLWRAVGDGDFNAFAAVNDKLLNPPGGALKNVPLKIYLPSSSSAKPSGKRDPSDDDAEAGSLRVVQSLVPPRLGPSENQTVGSALHALLPSLFPTKRSSVLARAVLHGAVLPLSAGLEDVMRNAAYADGWVHLGIVMLG